MTKIKFKVTTCNPAEGLREGRQHLRIRRNSVFVREPEDILHAVTQSSQKEVSNVEKSESPIEN